MALRRLRDETERSGKACRRALAAAPRHDADYDDVAALHATATRSDASGPADAATAQLLETVHRYAAAADDLGRLCAAAEASFGDGVVALAVTAPGPEVISDAELALHAEHMWLHSDAA